MHIWTFLLVSVACAAAKNSTITLTLPNATDVPFAITTTVAPNTTTLVNTTMAATTIAPETGMPSTMVPMTAPPPSTSTVPQNVSGCLVDTCKRTERCCEWNRPDFNRAEGYCCATTQECGEGQCQNVIQARAATITIGIIFLIIVGALVVLIIVGVIVKKMCFESAENERKRNTDGRQVGDDQEMGANQRQSARFQHDELVERPGSAQTQVPREQDRDLEVRSRYGPTKKAADPEEVKSSAEFKEV